MKKNIIMSVLIIAISATLIGGATMAWFTDAAEPIENQFTAGTVEIGADETIEPIDSMQENWNPGDVAEKEFTIINTGTKSIYLRATITGRWYENDGVTEFNPNPDEDVVTWTFFNDDAAANWTRVGNEWYYNAPIGGSYTVENALDRTVKLHLKVTLDGPSTGNQYQGKVFKLTTVFDAIQSSNGAVDDAWENNPY